MKPVQPATQVGVRNQKDHMGAKFRINTAFSLHALCSVFQTFDLEKRGLVQSIGLGGLLKAHNQRLQCRDLIFTLLSRMDPISGSIVLSNGILTVSDKDVHHVLGLPYKGKEIKLGTRPAAGLDKVKMALLLDTDAELNMDVVVGIILKDYGRKMSPTEREAFKVATIIFADSCFLGPRGDKRKINKEILEHVADGSRICGVNWSGYVLSVLRQSAGKIQQSSTCGHKSVFLEGCLIFLLVFYLDNLSAGFLTPSHDCLPRIAKYTARLVSELVSYDRRRKMPHSILQFGRAQLRPPNEVVYSRNVKSRSKDSLHRTRHDASVLSSHKVISIGSSESCSITDLHISKKDLDYCEAQDAFEEYINIFQAQLAQATDELHRKVHTLLGSFRHSGGIRSMSTSGFKGDTPFDEALLSISPICLGAKAKSRKEYRTFFSSSDSSIPASSSLARINAECEELAVQMFEHSPELLTSTVDRLSTSSLVDTVEGTQRLWLLVDESDGVADICDLSCCTYNLFGPSTFDLGIKDKDIHCRAIMEVIRVLPRLSEEEKKKSWYLHNVPSCIQIDGQTLYCAFYSDLDFSSDIMDAVMRLYHEFDNAFYLGRPEKRWRHYLPATWAEIALVEDNIWELALVKDMINGGHINYRVDECQLVLVPVLVLGEWSLYVWDFARKQITILDPVIATTQLLKRKHKTVASKLHNTLLSCRQEIIGQLEPLHNIWRMKYIQVTDDYPSISSNKSGLFTVFYSRFFDGQTVTRSMIMEDSVTLFQTNLLCQLLGSAGNEASCPVEITSAITENN